jgi:hypothetical protein
MSDQQIAPVEPGNRIAIPPEWADALGLHERVILDRTSNGILVRPRPAATWDDIFAMKLTINSAPPDAKDKDLEMAKDEFLF